MKNLLFLFLLVSFYYLGRYFYFRPGVRVAQICPPIEGKLINGESFDLSYLKGKYVLVDFWASWCGPCRKDATTLVSFQKKWNQVQFKNASGLEVLTIGLDHDEPAWKRAIEEDQYDWKYHIRVPEEFKSSLLQTFGVKSIPARILIDPNQNIISVNQSFVSMDELLSAQKSQN